MDHIEPKAKQVKTRCHYCGDSSVSHATTYFSYTTSVLFQPFDRFMKRNLSSPQLLRAGETLAHTLARLLFLVGLIKTNTDIDRAISIRSRMVWLEANKRNIPMEQIVIFGKLLEIYRAHVGGSWQYFESLPVAETGENEADIWLDDKFILKKKLREAGIPVPQCKPATSIREAKEILAKWSTPVVIKPRIGSRGRHTTVNVTNVQDLIKAYKLAKQLNYFVLIEEYLPGSVCRATIVDGVLRGFLKADPPTVTGDGKHTIRELIKEKNRNRPERIAEILIRPELIEFISRQGYTLNDILPKKTTIPLSHRTGRLFGGTTREMLSEIHPKLKKYVERAEQAINIPVLGLDLIIVDPTKDPDTQHWGFIEANSLPFIDLHDFPLEGKPANVSQYVWDLYLKNFK